MHFNSNSPIVNFIKKHSYWICCFCVSAAFITILIVHADAPAKEYLPEEIFVGTVAIGGMDYDDAQNILEKHVKDFLAQPVMVRYAQNEYKTTLSTLGVQVNIFKTLENAYEESLQKNNAMQDDQDTKQHKTIIQPDVRIDPTSFANALRQLSGDPQAGKDEYIQKVINNMEQYRTVNADGAMLLLLPPTSEQRAGLRNERLKDRLLKQNIDFLYTEDGRIIFMQSIPMQDNWFSVDQDGFHFSQENIKEYMQSSLAPQINRKEEYATITTLPNDGVGYVNVEGKPIDGRSMLVEETVQNLIDSVSSGKYSAQIAVKRIPGTIAMQTPNGLLFLERLSRGMSNFADSPEGRDYNIRKGLNEKYNNLFIAPETTFSFNAVLGRVTHQAGWKDALAIFGGGGVSLVPGGGLCQVATTLYRAVLKTGLPIVKKSNHSLYVSYYREYGDGLDATIYPGVKDLQFKNDTSYPLLLLSHADGNDAFVDVYGVPTNRTVELIGPMYRNRVPEEYKNTIKPNAYQIVWIQKITESDGKAIEKKLTSSYTSRPY